jgi:hypothetical protein
LKAQGADIAAVKRGLAGVAAQNASAEVGKMFTRDVSRGCKKTRKKRVALLRSPGRNKQTLFSAAE